MGLSSSQARLLTLTSRQHSIEGEAQRIQANKLRLSNDSDMVYMKYLNALDETSLQTKQTRKSTGADSWVGGSINNLLRYGASDEYTGNVFYVQDLATGKLYMPEPICNSYETAEANGENTKLMDFIKKCDPTIIYERVDNNKYIIDDYKRAKTMGYDTAASDEILIKYNQALAKDDAITAPASSFKSSLPGINGKGVYVKSASEDVTIRNFKDSLKKLQDSAQYTTLYTQKERDVIESISIIIQNLEDTFSKKENTETTDDGDVIMNFHPLKLTASVNGVVYDNDPSFDYFDGIVCALNGGEISEEGKVDIKIIIRTIFYPKIQEKPNQDYNRSYDVYDTEISYNGQNIKPSAILSAYDTNCKSYGAALNSILNSKINSANNAKNYLDSIGKTCDDLTNYQLFKNLQAAYDSYVPDIEYIPSNKLKAAYYEQIFNSIQAAGGCIPADSSKCKNEAWVGNMIKSTQVILTAWDEEHEMLSKTLPSLNTHIQEVSDSNKIEQVAQEYEEELALINQKDTRFDKRLSVLETERNAITNEIDSLKQVMKANIETNFKVFS